MLLKLSVDELKPETNYYTCLCKYAWLIQIVAFGPTNTITNAYKDKIKRDINATRPKLMLDHRQRKNDSITQGKMT